MVKGTIWPFCASSAQTKVATKRKIIANNIEAAECQRSKKKCTSKHNNYICAGLFCWCSKPKIASEPNPTLEMVDNVNLDNIVFALF